MSVKDRDRYLRALTVKRLSSGYYHLRSIGPCNWAQPPDWPCSEEALREHAFGEACEDFIQACIESTLGQMLGDRQEPVVAEDGYCRNCGHAESFHDEWGCTCVTSIEGSVCECSVPIAALVSTTQPEVASKNPGSDHRAVVREEADDDMGERSALVVEDGELLAFVREAYGADAEDQFAGVLATGTSGLVAYVRRSLTSELAAHNVVVAFRRWCASAGYDDTIDDCPHVEAFFAGFHAGSASTTSAERSPESSRLASATTKAGQEGQILGGDGRAVYVDEARLAALFWIAHQSLSCLEGSEATEQAVDQNLATADVLRADLVKWIASAQSPLATPSPDADVICWCGDPDCPAFGHSPSGSLPDTATQDGEEE